MDRDPLWYKDAIIYEVHVRAFRDSNGDGIGDFVGLTEKLDYLADLGVTAIWLLPFYPSPLRDDGYDIADYQAVHPSYGSLRDVKQLVKEAHARDLKVITELVCNHTSDQHAWFQKARRAPKGSAARDFYVWSDATDRYPDARIIFKDFEASNWTWDPVAQQHYWHRFFHHQPDLNFENPQVRKAISKVLDFWLDMGIDGLRLDAIPYLYEREGTNCENLKETHQFLKDLRRHVDRHHEARMLLAEANQWPEDAVAYFGEGDECHMCFHFPVMPRMFMAIRMEDRFPIVDILHQTPAIPDSSQWALFLRNHDELTLEMVTDEERDYMYRVYATDRQARVNLGIRRRLAPLLGNNRRRIELMNALLFSLPGTPVLYYGDEIGMGDNIYLGDRNAVRTPMQWSADRNAGFSEGNRQSLYLPIIVDPEYHYEAVNVASQQQNPNSLLWWMKRLIALRKDHQAFGRGTLEFLHPDNRKVLAFIRRYQGEQILVVANLSRFPQYAELDLRACAGLRPVEMFGRVEFPAIGELPYLLTLGPHGFLWFLLESAGAPEVRPQEPQVPVLRAPGGEAALFSPRGRAAIEALLPAWMLQRRWFRSKTRGVKSARIVEVVPIELKAVTFRICLVEVEYIEGDPETYVVPLELDDRDAPETLRDRYGGGVLARVELGERVATLHDAMLDPAVSAGLLEAVQKRRRFEGERGTLVASPAPGLRELRGVDPAQLQPNPGKLEQSNTSVLFGDRLILKLYRRAEEGLNPDFEITRFLTERRRFSHVPALAGGLAWRSRKNGEEVSLAMLQRFVPNGGDAWRFTLDALGRFHERLLQLPEDAHPPAPGPRRLVDRTRVPLHPAVAEEMGAYLESARLLGRRTAEMHRALAADREDPAFAPEAFSTLYQRSMYQSMRTHATEMFHVLRRQKRKLPEGVQALAQEVIDAEGAVFDRLKGLLGARFTAMRIRHHGDFHLGQVLHTGNDFVIIDFEGEPARSLADRRLKRSALRDVAGMLRSFAYAAYTSLHDTREVDRPRFEPWTVAWLDAISGVYLGEYLEAAGDAPFLPRSPDELPVMLDVYLIEKAVYEVVYELNNRPDWVTIPLRGLAALVG